MSSSSIVSYLFKAAIKGIIIAASIPSIANTIQIKARTPVNFQNDF